MKILKKIISRNQNFYKILKRRKFIFSFKELLVVNLLGLLGMRNLSNISNISKSSSRNQVCKGISLSYDIWLQIDKDKGDISRSRFIQRLIEKAYSITGDYRDEQ